MRGVHVIGGRQASEVCPSQASAATQRMSGAAAAAMRAPLPEVSRTGSWSAACGNCTGGAAALAPLAQAERAALRQRCLDCGYSERGALRSGAAGGAAAGK